MSTLQPPSDSLSPWWAVSTL